MPKMQLNWTKATGLTDAGKLVTTYWGYEVGGPRALALTVSGTNAEVLAEAYSMADGRDAVAVVELGTGWAIEKEPMKQGRGADATLVKFHDKPVHKVDCQVDGSAIVPCDMVIRPVAAVMSKEDTLKKFSAFLDKCRPLPTVTK